MNKIKYIITVATVLVLSMGLFNACTDKFFDTDNGDRVSPDDYFKSGIEADLAVGGCYAMIQDVAERMVVVDGLLSDQMTVTGNATVDLININRHEVNLDNYYLNTQGFYKIIITANQILPKLPPIIARDRDFDSTVCEGYMGALITIRAWAYFTLVKYYNQAIWIDQTVTDVTPDNIAKEPTPKTQIIDNLIAELTPYIDETDIFRFPIDHYALLGELYLEKGDYANAIKYLKFCVDGPAHPSSAASPMYMVTGDYEKASWATQFVNSQNQGLAVLTAIPYSIDDNHPNFLQNLTSTYYMIKPTSSIIAAFEAEETSKGAGDLYRGSGISYLVSNDMPFIAKYLLDNERPSSADVILYRDADIHLLLAEALNRNGQSDAALLILNKGIGSVAASKRPEGFTKWSKNKGVRSRVDLVEREVPDGVDKVTYVEDLLIQERFEELAFEGKRYCDLMRIAKRRNNPAYLADKVSAKFSGGDASSIKSKLMTPDNWYLPVEY